MIVRKLKCRSCGASKVNKAITSYIYCDFCASFMGYDFEAAAEETMSLFDSKYYAEHGKWPDDVQEYVEIMQKVGKAIAAKNYGEYKIHAVKMMDIDIKLNPKRFSPRMKIPAYKEKYLRFYEASIEEGIRTGYYEKMEESNKLFMELAAKVNTKKVNDATLYVYDENLEKYFDKLKEFYKGIAEESKNSTIKNLHPEEIDDAYCDMVYKQSINAYVKSMDTETFEKVLVYLGLKNEYIEVDDVAMEHKNCANCGAALSVPKGSSFIMCEYCGNTNNSKKNEIKCINCSMPFSVDDKKTDNSCPSCGAVFKALKFNE